MKKKTILAICSILCLGCVIAGSVCSNSLTGGKELPPYDESGFAGSGIDGFSSMLDTVGYGTLSKYEHFDDGAVALSSNFFVPLKNSRTSEGFNASLSIERRDGVFNVMTEATNTGALYVLCEDKTDNITVRHRIYVLGVDDETSYIVVSGAQKHVWDSNYDYYERRYLIPLGNYCTGAPIDLKLTYYQNAYYVTVTAENGESYFKKIDKHTDYVANSNYSSDMSVFFENVERVIGLESLSTIAKFSDVSFTLGNDAAKDNAVTEQRTISLINNDAAGGSLSVSAENPERGENVIVSLKPNEGYYLDSFIVDGKNRKYRLYRAESDGYEYEIVGVQKDCTVEAKYTAGEEQTYEITGECVYTSGVWNPDANRYENAEDVLSVTAGIYSGEVVDGKFTVRLPKGYFEITANSEKFPSAQTSVTVEGAADVGDIVFDRLHYKTSVSYNADGSFEIAKKSYRLIDEVDATEGFVVNYTVKGGDGSWFNTGGLYMYDEANLTFDYIFVFSSSSRAQIVFVDGDRRADNGPTYNTTYAYSSLKSEIEVTVIYYEEQYHIVVGGAYACTIGAKTTLTDTDRGTLGEDFFAAKSRGLGLRSYDSSAVYSDVSYGLGNEAAIEAMKQLHVTVSAESAQGGEISLYNNRYAKLDKTSTQQLGERIIAEIVPSDGKIISEFTVNGEDCKASLQGAFDRNGTYVYKYVGVAVKGGLNIAVKFSNEDETQTVTGTYSYLDGEDGNVVSLKSGNIEGTAANGTFSIDLPKGTHVLTFTDENGRQATKLVCVKDEDVQTEEVYFRAPSFANATNVTETDNGYLVKSGYAALDGVIASEGFVLEYTVTATATTMWFEGGAMYFKMNDVYYTICIMPSNPNRGGNWANGNAIIGVQQSDVGALQVGYHFTDAPYADATQALKVKIVYLDGTFYFFFDDSSNAYVISQDPFTNDGFYTEGYRELGFRAWDTSSTYTNISYKLGNEYAKAAISGLTSYSLGKGSKTLFAGDSTTKAGEGFVARYTAKKSNDWMDLGSLVMKVGEYYYTLGVKSSGQVLVNGGTSLSSWSKTMLLGQLKDKDGKALTATESVTVTIAYYNGAFYVKGDNGTTAACMTFNSSSSYSWNNRMSVCDKNEKTLGLCGTDCKAMYSGVSYEIGDDAALNAIKDFDLTYSLAKGAAMLFVGEPETKAGEGFAARYTATGDMNGWKVIGSLLMQVGNNYYTLGIVSYGDIVVNYGTSLSSWSKTMYLGSLIKPSSDGKITVTIAYFGETFYIKADNGTESKTFSFDASSTWSWNNHMSVCSSSKRKLGLCGTDTAVTYTDVSYKIGDESAKTAIEAMGFSVN